MNQDPFSLESKEDRRERAGCSSPELRPNETPAEFSHTRQQLLAELFTQEEGRVFVPIFGDSRMQGQPERRHPCLPPLEQVLDQPAPVSKAPGAPSGDSQRGKVTRDQVSGDLKIIYPGGTKSREIKFDPRGQAQTVITRDASGTTTLVRRGQQWFMSIQDMELPMPGNIAVEPGGDITFELSPKGFVRRERVDGTISIDEVGAGRRSPDDRILLDDQNRIKQIDVADGTKTRTYEYFEDSSELKAVTIVEKTTGQTLVFTRRSKDSLAWECLDSRGYRRGTWYGEVRLSQDGVHSIRAARSDGFGRPGGRDNAGRWSSYHPDGRETRDEIKPDNSRLSYDKSGKLRSVLAADGSTTDIGDAKVIIYNPRTGETITWTKTGDQWKSDSAKFTESVKDLEVNERCEVSFSAADGHKHSLLSDGRRLVSRKDGVKLEVSQSGEIQSIIKGDLVRKLVREGDKIVGAVDTDKSGRQRVVFTKTPGDDVTEATLDKDGNLRLRRGAGAQVVEKADFSRVELDGQGDPRSVTTAKGHRREFIYGDEGGRKRLNQIVEVKKTETGERVETWNRRPGTDDFVCIGSSGKEKVRRNVEVLKDQEVGAYKYRSAEGKERLSRIGSDAGEGALSESVEEARERLLEVMKEKLPQANYRRLEQMVKGFEERMADRAYLRRLAGLKGQEEIDSLAEKTVRETYDKLSELVSAPDGSTFYDQRTRVKLAENFMFHAMDPTTMDQGPSSEGDRNGHGTCWIQSGHIWGMTQHPGAMADLLKQVALTGTYTTKNSGERNPAPRTFSFSPGYLSFRSGTQEAEWTIESACDQWKRGPGYMRQCDGDRSPVGKIFDYVIPLLGGTRRPGDIDGGLYEDATGSRNPRYHAGARSLMYRITGDVPVDAPFRGGRRIGRIQYPKGHLINGDMRQSLLEKGSVMTYTERHLRSMHLKRINGEWVIYQDDQHGELGARENKDTIIAKITDIERWARGDRSVERPVKEKPRRQRLEGSGDADAIGGVRPRGGGSSGPEPSPQPDPNRRRRAWRF